jgi:hypothetical protein
MRKIKKRREISFKATPRKPKIVHISFETKRGEKVSFKARKRVPKKVKLSWK